MFTRSRKMQALSPALADRGCLIDSHLGLPASAFVEADSSRWRDINRAIPRKLVSVPQRFWRSFATVDQHVIDSPFCCGLVPHNIKLGFCRIHLSRFPKMMNRRSIRAELN